MRLWNAHNSQTTSLNPHSPQSWICANCNINLRDGYLGLEKFARKCDISTFSWNTSRFLRTDIFACTSNISRASPFDIVVEETSPARPVHFLETLCVSVIMRRRTTNNRIDCVCFHFLDWASIPFWDSGTKPLQSASRCSIWFLSYRVQSGLATAAIPHLLYFIRALLMENVLSCMMSPYTRSPLFYIVACVYLAWCTIALVYVLESSQFHGLNPVLSRVGTAKKRERDEDDVLMLFTPAHSPKMKALSGLRC